MSVVLPPEQRREQDLDAIKKIFSSYGTSIGIEMLYESWKYSLKTSSSVTQSVERIISEHVMDESDK